MMAAFTQGTLSNEQLCEFVASRYEAAIGFVDLLRACVEKSTEQIETGNTHLIPLLREAQHNLDDELGIANGVQCVEANHETWRIKCYGSMGVDAVAAVTGIIPCTANLLNLGTAGWLKRFGTPFQIAGAILFIELMVPHEFDCIRSALYRAFPESFVDKPGDHTETLARKAEARQYLDKHILTDARHHGPDLLDALDEAVQTHEQLEQVLSGIRLMAGGRLEFYNEHARQFGIMD